MLLVPDDVEVAVGDELDCEVRFTTTTFDRGPASTQVLRPCRDARLVEPVKPATSGSDVATRSGVRSAVLEDPAAWVVDDAARGVDSRTGSCRAAGCRGR